MPDCHPNKENLLDALCERFVAVIQNGPTIDELSAIFESFETYTDYDFGEGARESLDNAIDNEFSNIEAIVRGISSEDDLSDHLTQLEALAKQIGRDVGYAQDAVNRRMAELEQPENDEWRPEMSKGGSFPWEEKFGDDQMRSLFSNLLQ